MKFPIDIKNKNALRIIAGVIYLAVIMAGITLAVNRGLSQYAAAKAIRIKSVGIASQAIDEESSNPEAYRARALLLVQNGDYRKSVEDYRRAIDLRANDYLLWLQLGYAYFKLNDFDAAQNAYDKAVSLAPRYGGTQRYLGQLYLKENNQRESFAHFRQAAELDPNLLPEVIGTARQEFSGDAEAIEQAVQPATVEGKKRLAFYFLRNDLMSGETRRFLTGDELDKSDKEEFVSELIERRKFHLAYDIWSSESDQTAKNNANLISNGGFESAIDLKAKNFGWLIKNEKNVVFSIESEKAFSETASLKIKFDGNSSPDAAILSQLVPVAPKQTYRLTFAAAAEELTTGGLPVVKITDADSGKLLGQSSPIRAETNGWQSYSIDFNTTDRIEAVKISVQRLGCPSETCPAFGVLRLDNFLLKKS